MRFIVEEPCGPALWLARVCAQFHSCRSPPSNSKSMRRPYVNVAPSILSAVLGRRYACTKEQREIYGSRSLTTGNTGQARGRDASSTEPCMPRACSAANARDSRSRRGPASTSRAPCIRSAPRPCRRGRAEEGAGAAGRSQDAGHLALPPHVEELQEVHARHNLLCGAQVYMLQGDKRGRNFAHDDGFKYRTHTDERISTAFAIGRAAGCSAAWPTL